MDGVKTMKYILETKNLTKVFKNNLVFQNVNLTFQKGKSYLIKGYNGCGKSVLLKTLCGFSLPNGGEVIYKEKVKIGKDIDFIQNAGVSINSPEFISYMTGKDNLLLLAGINKQISKEKINQVVSLLKLDEFINKKYKTYSLGTKQKLRLAQAIMENPEILILDEPVNALDKNMVCLIWKILQEYVDKGGTLIFTTHGEEEIPLEISQIYEFQDKTFAPVNS